MYSHGKRSLSFVAHNTHLSLTEPVSSQSTAYLRNGDIPMSPFVILLSNLLPQCAQVLPELGWLTYLGLASEHGEESRVEV
jgi:hypothetical protein